ncbi:MAG TPA: enolase C-terminal domain-like protein [Gemmatimonadaceae bacterium]|nr:enolase C-terminal domain-like protein [Gemmatimonadaceae bacterium]
MSGYRTTIDRLTVSAYAIPTDHPESDGTLAWTTTTMVLVEASAGDQTGLGYSYTHQAAASLIEHTLADAILGRAAFDVNGAWDAMLHAIRNFGRPGIASSAIAAVDIALWDLKARLLDLPLMGLLGAVRNSAPVYGSGGFTSYSVRQLCQQLAGWVRQGIPRVKMKVGTDPREDPERVRAAREAIGPDAELFVDANGAYDRKQALAFAEHFAESGASWFEEPVSSDDLDGLRLIRDRAPAGMDIAAGEYGYDVWYFRRMLDAGAVDVLQADATRCAGITGFMRAGTLCEARSLPFSAHTAPSVHAHPACALPALRHVEYFHDHARVEHMLFDGALEPMRGELRPDKNRPGLGLAIKRADAARFAIH